MLEAIKDAVISIGQFFADVVDFVLKLIQDLLYLIELVGQAVGKIPSYFTWLPANVVALIVALIAIVVVYKVLGREG